MQKYFVMRNSGQAVFVKEAEFFEAQKRESGPNDQTWWTHWTPVYAEGIEHARLIGETQLPKHRWVP